MRYLFINNYYNQYHHYQYPWAWPNTENIKLMNMTYSDEAPCVSWTHLSEEDFRVLRPEPLPREVIGDSPGPPVADIGNGGVHGALLPLWRQHARAQLQVGGQQGEEAHSLLIEGLLDSGATVGDWDS